MKIRFTRALLLFYISLIVSCSDSRETRLQRYLIQGNEKLVGQEYEQAERFYKEALRLDSCFADALNNLGTVYHRKGDNERAIGFYTRAIDCTGGYADAYVNRANAYYELNQPLLSLKDLDLLAMKKPDTIVLYQLRALNFWKLHNYTDAIRNFAKMLERTPDDADILINLGTIYSSKKQFDSARYYLNRALQLKPGEPNTFNALALIEAENGNLIKASEWLEKALKINPHDAYFLNNKGYIHLLDGNYDEALPLINESIGIDPYNGWAYRNKGLFYLKTGNADEAIRLFKRAEQSDSLMDNLYYWLGDAYALKNDKTGSCSYYQKAFQYNQIPESELKRRCN
jgi:tetratricopeptide (TPR) repeat protein